MQRTIIAAAALLFIQIALAVALNMTSRSGDVSPAAPLMNFSTDGVTGLEIAGPDGERLTIRRAEGGWILPEAFNAPAAGDRVDELLARLADLRQGLAVATTEEAARRFKVAENGFERHVVVKQGEEIVGDLYVGTSPAFRQVHARRAGTKEIVTVTLSTFELETGPDKWLDKNLFQLRQEEMEALTFADFTLRRNGGDWQLADLEEGKATDRDAAADLAAGIGGLTIQDVLNPRDAAALFTGEPALSFAVELKDGGKLDYRFARPEGDYFVIKRSDRELYGKVHTIQAENLGKYTRDKLIKPEEELPAESREAPAAAEAQESEGPRSEGRPAVDPFLTWVDRAITPFAPRCGYSVPKIENEYS